MASYPVADQSIVEIKFEGRHELQQVMSIFHYQLRSGSLLDGYVALESLLSGVMVVGGIFQKWTDCLSEKVTNIKVTGQWIAPDRFAYIEKVDPLRTEGTVAGNAYPVNTAVALTKRTLNSGRSQVGTLHMPGVPESFLLNGELTAAATTAYGDLKTRILASIVTATPAEYYPVLYHRSSPTVAPLVTDLTVNPYARIMRRRTVGLGS